MDSKLSTISTIQPDWEDASFHAPELLDLADGVITALTSLAKDCREGRVNFTNAYGFAELCERVKRLWVSIQSFQTLQKGNPKSSGYNLCVKRLNEPLSIGYHAKDAVALDAALRKPQRKK